MLKAEGEGLEDGRWRSVRMGCVRKDVRCWVPRVN